MFLFFFSSFVQVWSTPLLSLNKAGECLMPTMGMERSVHSSIVTPAGTFQNVVVVSATASFVCVQKKQSITVLGHRLPNCVVVFGFDKNTTTRIFWAYNFLN